MQSAGGLPTEHTDYTERGLLKGGGECEREVRVPRGAGKRGCKMLAEEAAQ